MLILAITSSTSRVGCAIGDRSGVKAVVQAVRERQHAELLSSQISVACNQAGVALQDITAVAVDVGPGLYTGLRVGVVTAMTVAHALKVPVIRVSSVQLVAFGVRSTRSMIVAVVDAKRGEVFYFYQWFQADKLLLDRDMSSVVRVAKPEEVVLEIQRLGPVVDPSGSGSPDEEEILLVGDGSMDKITKWTLGRSGGGDILFVGDGAIRYASTFAELRNAKIADRGFAYPSAESLVIYASRLVAYGNESYVDADKVRPLYLRRPDAKPVSQII